MSRPGKSNLYPKGRYVYSVAAGEVIQDGKVYYPSSVEVTMKDRYWALDIIQQLARQMQDPELKEFSIHLQGGDIRKLKDD